MSKRIIVIVVVLLVISVVAFVYYFVSRVPGDIEVKGDESLALATGIVGLATAIVAFVTALLVLWSRRRNQGGDQVCGDTG